MLRYSLDNAVLHPQRVFVNAVVVDTWTAIVFIQEEGAALKNAQKKRSLKKKDKNMVFLFCFFTEVIISTLKSI